MGTLLKSPNLWLEGCPGYTDAKSTLIKHAGLFGVVASQPFRNCEYESREYHQHQHRRLRKAGLVG